MPGPARISPPPLVTDDVRTVAVGTALWVVALIGVALLRGSIDDSGRWLATCAAGVVLGLLGVAFLVRRARRLAAHPEVPAAERPPAG